MTRSIAPFFAIVLPAFLGIILGHVETMFVTIVVNGFLLFYLFNALKRRKLVNSSFILFALYILVVSSFAILSFHSSIKLGSDTSPFIPGGDGETYFMQAKQISQASSLEEFRAMRSNFYGFQIILAIVFKIFGVNLFYGMAMNYFLLVISVYLIYISTLMLSVNIQIAKYTLICLMISPHLLQFGTILLKDIIIIFGFSLVMYSSTILRDLFSLKYYLYIIFSIILVGILRVQFIIPMLFFPILILKNKLNKTVSFALFVIGFAVLISPFILQFTTMDFNRSYFQETILENRHLDSRIELRSGGTVDAILRGYSEFSVFKKTAYIPVTSAIQIVTPFNFWNLLFLKGHFWLFIRSQLNVIWVFYLSIFMLFSIFNFKKIQNSYIKNLFLVGVLYFVFIAFIYGGVEPRYSTPSLVLIFPAIGYWLNEFKSNNYANRKITLFFVRYYIVGFLLFISYIIRAIF